jgi:hypothetical protein
MANGTVEARTIYAKQLGTRAWIVFKTKRGEWRGLFIDFEFNQQKWTSRSEVRSRATGKAWADKSAQPRPRGSRSQMDKEIL